VQHPLQAAPAMSCNSSSNAEQPAATEAAYAATEVSANALPAALQAAPDSTVAPAATVRDQFSSAVPPSPSLIEGLSQCTPRSKLHTVHAR
jgi:hypothetical protein